jgi:hypothetical protein
VASAAGIDRSKTSGSPHVPSSHRRDKPGDGRASQRSCRLAIPARCNAGYGNKAGFFGAESFSWIAGARSNSGHAPQGGSLKLVTVSGLFRRHAIRVATSRALFKAPSGRDAKPPRCAGGDAQELIFPAIIAVPAPGAGLPSEPPPAGERGRFRPAVVCCSQT